MQEKRTAFFPVRKIAKIQTREKKVIIRSSVLSYQPIAVRRRHDTSTTVGHLFSFFGLVGRLAMPLTPEKQKVPHFSYTQLLTVASGSFKTTGKILCKIQISSFLMTVTKSN